MSKFTFESKNDFTIYMKSSFPEHSRRILEARKNASWARILYPISFLVFPFLFFCSFAVLLFLLKEPFSKNTTPKEFLELISQPHIQNAFLGVVFIGIILSLICFFLGLFVGFQRARSLLFEAEKLEMSSKLIWLTEETHKEQEYRQQSEDDALSSFRTPSTKEPFEYSRIS
jgi:ABC-type Fe3+ transport system permease subunit